MIYQNATKQPLFLNYFCVIHLSDPTRRSRVWKREPKSTCLLPLWRLATNWGKHLLRWIIEYRVFFQQPSPPRPHFSAQKEITFVYSMKSLMYENIWFASIFVLNGGWGAHLLDFNIFWHNSFLCGCSFGTAAGICRQKGEGFLFKQRRVLPPEIIFWLCAIIFTTWKPVFEAVAHRLYLIIMEYLEIPLVIVVNHFFCFDIIFYSLVVTKAQLTNSLSCFYDM